MPATKPHFSRRGLAAICLLALCAGCNQAHKPENGLASDGRAVQAVARAQSPAPEDAAKPPSDAQPGTIAASPENAKSAANRLRFANATRGLRFEPDGVIVAEPLAPDRERAAALIADGQALHEHNDHFGSIEAFGTAVRTAPDFAPAYHGLGVALLGRGKTDEAIASFRTAVALDGALADARYSLATTLHMGGRSEEAIHEMSRLIQVDPNHVQAHERLAIWHYYAGDHAQAWSHAIAAENAGHAMPPQFIALLEKQMARPR